MTSTSGRDNQDPELLGGSKDELYGEPATFLGRCAPYHMHNAFLASPRLFVDFQLIWLTTPRETVLLNFATFQFNFTVITRSSSLWFFKIWGKGT